MRRRWLLILGQGVQEVLKGSGKDMYTLRFETEQLAQEWRRGFELIAKVSGSTCSCSAFAFSPLCCSTRLLCSILPQLSYQRYQAEVR